MKKITVSLFICASIISSCNNSLKNEQQVAQPVLLSDTASDASCVFLTEDEKNLPVISWCETNRVNDQKNFYMAAYDKSTGRFSSQLTIPIEQNARFHEEGMPKIAIKANGTIVAVYETAAPSDSNKFAGFVHYIFSTDKGRTWTSPACIHNDTTGGKSHSFASITRLSDGEIGACWLDESLNRSAGGRPVVFAKTNGENKFGDQLIIDSLACQCCRIAINSNAAGRITVAFRDINDSIRDMSVCSSDDKGRTFTRAVSFSKDGWVINGCPHNGPSIASGANNIYAAWFTGGPRKGVYYCEMNERKEMLLKQLVSNHGRFIQLCLMPDGSRILAYNENAEEDGKVHSKIVLNKIADNKTYSTDLSTGKSMASYPVIRSFGSDKVIVAWSDNQKIYYNIKDIAGINARVQQLAMNVPVVMQDLSYIKLSNSKDPVCGMPLSMAPGDTTSFKGRVYGFCSDICKNQFLQKPGSFIK